jgi:hypothetical protein
MLHKVISHLRMSISILDCCMQGEEIKTIRRHQMIKNGKRTLMVIQMIIHCWSFVVTLDNHVAHDHVSIHHLPHVLLGPRKCRIPVQGNTRSSLQHTKYTVDIIHATLLSRSKVRLPLTWRVTDCLPIFDRCHQLGSTLMVYWWPLIS